MIGTKNRGITLVEILVSLGIFTLIGLALTSFNRNIFFLGSTVQGGLKDQFEARKILRNMIAELRSASPSSLGAYPIAQAGTSSITFYSNVDSDSYKERIRYFIQGNELRRGLIKPSGNPLVYNTGQENIQVLLSNILATSTPIFDYYPQTYTGTSSPLTTPVNIQSISLIKITVRIDSDPTRAPRLITATSQVTLRNLKGNL